MSASSVGIAIAVLLTFHVLIILRAIGQAKKEILAALTASKERSPAEDSAPKGKR